MFKMIAEMEAGCEAYDCVEALTARIVAICEGLVGGVVVRTVGAKVE